MNRKRLLTFAAGALVVAATAGGVAYATIPDGNGVYSACMLKGVGTVRLVDKSLPSTNLMSHCTDKEIEISWNQAGQPGPAGPAGAKGDPGAPGATGTNGTDGVSGYQTVNETFTTSNTSASPTGPVVSCPAGKVPLSGGFSAAGVILEVSELNGIETTVAADGRVTRTGSWRFGFVDYVTGPVTITVSVNCAIAN